MSSFTCNKCRTPLAFVHGLVCHVCNPELVAAMNLPIEDAIHLAEETIKNSTADADAKIDVGS